MGKRTEKVDCKEDGASLSKIMLVFQIRPGCWHCVLYVAINIRWHQQLAQHVVDTTWYKHSMEHVDDDESLEVLFDGDRVQFRQKADAHEGVQRLGYTIWIPADTGVCKAGQFHWPVHRVLLAPHHTIRLVSCWHVSYGCTHWPHRSCRSKSQVSLHHDHFSG